MGVGDCRIGAQGQMMVFYDNRQGMMSIASWNGRSLQLTVNIKMLNFV
jgi:hypothetical protein